LYIGSSDDVLVVSRIEADHRIMPCEAVFDDESCHRSVRIHREQHVVPHAEADDDVERGLCAVEKLRLENGIAGRFEFIPAVYFVLGRDIQLCFVDSSAAAGHRANLEPVLFQYRRCPGGFIVETAAEGDADLFGAEFLREFGDFPYPRPEGYDPSLFPGSLFIVALLFNQSGLEVEILDFLCFVSRFDLLNHVLEVLDGTVSRKLGFIGYALGAGLGFAFGAFGFVHFSPPIKGDRPLFLGTVVLAQ